MTQTKDTDLGARRASIRVRKGLTQQGLADLAGLSRQTVNRAEGAETVGLDAITRLAEALGVSAAVYLDPQVTVGPAASVAS